MTRLLANRVLRLFTSRSLCRTIAEAKLEDSFVIESDVRLKASVLTDLLRISENDAMTAFEENPSLRFRGESDVREVAEFLLSRGLSQKDIAKKLKILDVPPHQIKFKCGLVEKISNYIIHESYPLLAVDMKCLLPLKFNRFEDSRVFSGKSRPEFVAAKLNLSPVESCDLFDRYDFLALVSAHKLASVFSLLLAAGIAATDIASDLWIIRHNLDVMRRRIGIAKERNVPLKPWLLRCPESRFNKSISSHLENIHARGANADMVEYIANRLECSTDDVKEQFAKFPPLERVSPKKIKYGLDVLCEAGFMSDRILGGLRVLAYSPEKIAERLELLKKYHKDVYLVTPLSWPDRNFIKFYGLPSEVKRGNKK